MFDAVVTIPSPIKSIVIPTTGNTNHQENIYIPAANKDLSAYSNCLQQTFKAYNDCTTQCSTKREFEREACFASFAGSDALIETNNELLEACLSESRTKNEACWNDCADKKNNDLPKCT